MFVPTGQKCIHVVATQGYLSLVENLVQLGADINAQVIRSYLRQFVIQNVPTLRNRTAKRASLFQQEQCNGRTALHLAVDLQNFELVRLLVSNGADVHSLTYGGHTPYHLTYGRTNGDIQKALYELTAPHLRELPDSESEDSDEYCEDSDGSEVCVLHVYIHTYFVFSLYCVGRLLYRLLT